MAHIQGCLLPVVFSGSTEMVVRLFEALQTEHVNLRSSVQEALASLADAYKVRRLTLWTTIKDDQKLK
jgi:hypothetical protein